MSSERRRNVSEHERKGDRPYDRVCRRTPNEERGGPELRLRWDLWDKFDVWGGVDLCVCGSREGTKSKEDRGQ